MITRSPMSQRAAAAALFIAVLMFAAVFGQGASAGGPIVVDSTNHPGTGSCDLADCTLDEAIQAANIGAGHDVITFDPTVFPPGAPATIDVTGTALTASTDPAGLFINGIGAGVIIDGSLLAAGEHGLEFRTSATIALADVAVHHVTVQNFPGIGVSICGGDAPSCEGDVDGTEVMGVESSHNGDDGLQIWGGEVTDTQLRDCQTDDNERAGVDIYATATNLIGLAIDSCGSLFNDSQGMNIHAVGMIDGVTVTDSTASGNNNDGFWIHSDTGDNQNVTVEGNKASSNNSGIHLDAGGQTTGAFLSENVVNSNTRGFRIEGTGGVVNTELASNVISTNTTGIETEATDGTHHNYLFGNTTGIEKVGAGSLNANNNWWGCNAGPNSALCDTTAGQVDGDPWLVLGMSVDPAVIAVGGTSTVSADLTMNSVGADTSALGYVSEIIEIIFATDFGSVGSQQTAESPVNGVAHATLTADQGPGTANLTVDLNNETLNDTVEITDPTPTPSPTATATPGIGVIWGDADCSGFVGLLDALLTILFAAELSAETGDCPEFGEAINVVDASQHVWGDFDCDESVSTSDSIAVAAHLAELDVDQGAGCPDVGEAVTLAGA